MSTHNKCKTCSKEIIPNTERQSLMFAPHYCSKYCKLFSEQKLSLTPKGGWPTISCKCDNCEKEFQLKNKRNTKDQVFCGKECLHQVMKCKKHSMKDYTLLRILRAKRKPVSAYDLTYLMDNQHQYRVKPNGISCKLRRWVAKGVVITNRTPKTRNENTITTYQLSPEYENEPLGALVIKTLTPKTN